MDHFGLAYFTFVYYFVVAYFHVAPFSEISALSVEWTSSVFVQTVMCFINHLSIEHKLAFSFLLYFIWKEHIAAVLHFLHCLPIDFRVKVKILLLTHKALSVLS